MDLDRNGSLDQKELADGLQNSSPPPKGGFGGFGGPPKGGFGGARPSSDRGRPKVDSSRKPPREPHAAAARTLNPFLPRTV